MNNSSTYLKTCSRRKANLKYNNNCNNGFIIGSTEKLFPGKKNSTKTIICRYKRKTKEIHKYLQKRR